MEIALTFTEKENEAIRTERQLWTSSVPLEPDQRLIVHPKMANAIDALGLIEYVRTLVAAAHDLPQSERGVVLEEATKVQIKAYVMHDLPYYLYLWATLCEEKGDAERATRLYALFLEEQNRFQPDKIDALVIKYLAPEHWFNIDGATQYARQATGSG